MSAFDGLDLHLGNLYRLSSAQTRSISPENFDGKPGQGSTATEGTGASLWRDGPLTPMLRDRVATAAPLVLCQQGGETAAERR